VLIALHSRRKPANQKQIIFFSDGIFFNQDQGCPYCCSHQRLAEGQPDGLHVKANIASQLNILYPSGLFHVEGS
jgi:hypothetical protein